MRFPTCAVLALTALLVIPRTSQAKTGLVPVQPAVSAALSAAAAGAGLRPQVLDLAMRAHARAVSEGRTSRSILTVIDYSLPSRERRLWVLDIERGEVLARELVAHGKNSGDDIARRFSNTEGSNQSSLGTFITGATYQGKHGLSLRLNGLDAELNSRAAARAIVVHAAD